LTAIPHASEVDGEDWSQLERIKDEPGIGNRSVACEVIALRTV
jgi:hypothetical protein